MKPILNNILCVRHAHPRDKHIQFFEEDHKYIVDLEPDTKYTSVTTWIHEHFEKFDSDKVIEKMMSGPNWKKGHKYWDMTAEQIKSQWNTNKDSVSGAGTDLHYEIECFNNSSKRFRLHYTNAELAYFYMANEGKNLPNKPLEWQYFINFINDHPDLKPYRTEWVVFNEDIKISGSIDMVYENPDGTLSIYDWKRSKEISKVNNWKQFATNSIISHLHDTNFWHYALQLNTYKAILERKYGKKVTELCLIRLHPDCEEDTYEKLEVPLLDKEIQDLFKQREEMVLIEKQL
jgi:ATP-dependent exoDNAse (exonuclease V) beta subunit